MERCSLIRCCLGRSISLVRMLGQAAAVRRVACITGVQMLLHCASVMRRFDAEQAGCTHCCLRRHDEEQDPQNQAAQGTHTSILANRRGDHMRSGTASQQKGSRRPEGFGQTQPPSANPAIKGSCDRGRFLAVPATSLRARSPHLCVFGSDRSCGMGKFAPNSRERAETAARSRDKRAYFLSLPQTSSRRA